MTRRGFLTLSAALLALGAWSNMPAAGPAESREAASVVWQMNLRAAHDVAVRDDKPMLLVFGAKWCVFCKKLEKQTLGHPQMAAYVNATFVPVHLDLDRAEDKHVAEILEIESLPCTVVLSPQADLLARIEGYHQPPAFYQRLTAAQQLHSTLQTAAAVDK